MSSTREVRFRVRRKTIRGARRWQRILLVAGCLLGIGAGYALYRDSPWYLSIGLVVDSLLCLIVSLALRHYAGAFEDGKFDLVLAGDTLRLPWGSIERGSIVSATPQSVRPDQPVTRLLLRTEEPSRPWVIHLKRYSEGSEIPAAIERWMAAG